MEILIVVSQALLVFVTGAYVALTWRLARSAERAAAAAERQTSLANWPHLHCDLHARRDKLILTIANAADVPAVEVDITVLGCWSTDEIDQATFVADYMTAEPIIERWRAHPEGTYGLTDRLYYFLFPPKKKVQASLGFPTSLPSTCYAFIQYRSITRTNYAQSLWFFEDRATGRFRLGDADPPVEQERFDVTEMIPSSATEEIFGLWAIAQILPYSRSVSYAKSFNEDWEDRGEWSEI